MAKMGGISIDELVTGESCNTANESADSHTKHETVSEFEKMMLEELRGIDPKYYAAAIDVLAAIKRQHPVSRPIKAD